MKKIVVSAIVILAIVIGCVTARNAAPEKSIKIDFESKSGSNVTGDAIFSEKNGKVTLTANIANLKPGTHAIHIHEKSDCSAPDATSAGGHWNPTFKKHGKWGVGEYHRGDIGNFTTDEFGNGKVTFSTDEWCIGCADETKNILGKSLMVHEKADDFVTQPTGDAGGRVACSAIIQ